VTETPQEREEDGTWSRLRHRKVVQWGIAYAAGAWGFLQGLQYVSDAFAWPPQIRQVAILALLMGLPVALVIAWYHGDRGEQRVTRVELAVLTLLFLLGGFMFLRYKNAGEPSAQIHVRPVAARAASGVIPASVAILPFENRSDERADAHFADGIHDDILTQLAKIGALKVIARTSVEQFRNTKLTTREIGAALGVATVLEGGVQRAGNRVRVNVQLIDAASDTQLWAERYDRELSAANIFAIQTEVAAAIATALKATLSPSYRTRARALPTRSLEAWEAYQLGRQRMERRNSEALAQAEEFFRRATQSDPDFALAYAAQAEVALLQMEYSGRPFEDGFAAARAAVDRALALDPALAEALTMSACLIAIDDNEDLDRAEVQYRLAIKLNPNYATALHWYSGLLAAQGRAQESLDFAEKAQAVDPLSAPVNLDVGRAFERLGRFDEALRSYQRVIEIEPSMSAAYFAMAFLQADAFGRLDLAIPWAEKGLALDPGNPMRLMNLGFIHRQLGGSHEFVARRLFEEAAQKGASLANCALATEFLAAGERARARRYAMEGYRALPDHPFALVAIAIIDIADGDARKALGRYQKAFPELVDGVPPRVSYYATAAAIDLAWVLQQSGDSERAAALLDQAEKGIVGRTRLGGDGIGIMDARIHALRGEPAKALAAIQAAVQAGWRMEWRYFRDTDPALASIRKDPEFQAAFAEIERDMARQRAALASRPKDAPLPTGVAAQ
jgi:TolB-like protein